jgi:hypothetical protein
MRRIFFFTVLIFITSATGAQIWTLKDSGIGLIIDNGDNKPLKIMKRSTIWDARELKENGAMEGKYNGNQLFAAWIQGPETKEYLNSMGKPLWMNNYKITYPDGKNFESECIDFLSSGFSYFGINAGAYTEGVWKIEWFIYNRNTHQNRQVATKVFQIIWGKEEQITNEIFKVKSK